MYEDEFSAPPVQHCALDLHAVIAQVAGRPYHGLDELPVAVPVEPRARAHLRHAGARPSSRTSAEGSAARAATASSASSRRRRNSRAAPCRYVLSQEETFQTYIRPAYANRMKTGVKRDGTIVARHNTFYVDVGAYAISGARSANNTLKVATGPYKLPHARVDCYAVYTNKPPSAPYRGLPTTQHTMSYEAQLDRIARDLGIDRLEIRRKNLVRGRRHPHHRRLPPLRPRARVPRQGRPTPSGGTSRSRHRRDGKTLPRSRGFVHHQVHAHPAPAHVREQRGDRARRRRRVRDAHRHRQHRPGVGHHDGATGRRRPRRGPRIHPHRAQRHRARPRGQLHHGEPVDLSHGRRGRGGRRRSPPAGPAGGLATARTRSIRPGAQWRGRGHVRRRRPPSSPCPNWSNGSGRPSPPPANAWWAERTALPTGTTTR